MYYTFALLTKEGELKSGLVKTTHDVFSIEDEKDKLQVYAAMVQMCLEAFQLKLEDYAHCTFTQVTEDVLRIIVADVFNQEQANADHLYRPGDDGAGPVEESDRGSGDGAGGERGSPEQTG